MKKIVFCNIALALILLLLTWPRSASAQIELPPADWTGLGGGTVAVTDINEVGQIVGYAFVVSDLVTTGFRWNPDGSMTKVYGSCLDPICTSPYNVVHSINNQGQIVGCYGTSQADTRAFAWEIVNGVETFSDLGTLGFQSSESACAYDINDQGQAVGVSEIALSDVDHAVLWDNVGATNMYHTDLDTDFTQGAYSVALGVNESGSVVGWRIENGYPKGFVYVGNHMLPLYTAIGIELQTIPVGMNDLTQVAGDAVFQTLGRLPTLWEYDGTSMGAGVPLALFPGVDPNSASGINDLGQVIGTSGSPGFGFVWDSTNGAVSLNANTTDSNMTPPSLLNASSSTPWDINNLGQIVGTMPSANTGDIHAFLWQSGYLTELSSIPNGSQPSARLINSWGQIAGTCYDGSGHPNVVRWVLPLPPPPPPQAIVDRLNEGVVELVDDGALTPGLGTSLTSKLGTVSKHLAKDKTKPAANVLGAFVNQTESLLKRAVLDEDEAMPLIMEAADLIKRLNE